MNVKNYFIYHHDDPDGNMAAANVAKMIVDYNQRFSDKWGNFMTRYGSYETDYNDYGFTAHKTGDIIYVNGSIDVIFVVDLSFSRHTIDSLINLTENKLYKVVWIDHHQSSIDVVNEYGDKLDSMKNLFYFVSNDLSGAALVEALQGIVVDLGKILFSNSQEDYELQSWFKGVKRLQYSKDSTPKSPCVETLTGFRKYPISRATYYIDQYDRWTKQDPDADLFVSGLRLNGYKYNNGCNSIYKYYEMSLGHYSVYYDYDVERIIEEGRLASRANNMLMEEQLDRVGRVDFTDGTIYMKMCCGNSLNFCHLADAQETAFVMVVGWDVKLNKFSCSIYRNNNNADKLTITAKEIADLFGGGGHDGAAGFKTNLNMMDMLPKYAHGRTMREAFKVLSFIETGEHHE